MDRSMQRILISSESEWVFMTRFVGKHNIFKMFLDNQATPRMFKNRELVSLIRAGRNAIIGDID